MRGILPGMRSPTKRLLAPAAILVLAFAGCGETTIDGGALENEIVADAEREGLVLDGAECPSPDAEEGDTFECTVVVKGEERTLEVVQRNDDGNVEYELGPLLDSSAGSDAGGDEASVRFVVDAVNRDVTALCDYSTPALRRKLARDRNCANEVLAEYDDGVLDEYEVEVEGDEAAAADARRTIALERRANGSWLITDIR
jgi:hypothetical protein